MRFSKWHALGNSYLIVERADSGPLTTERVRWLCDVDRGIGSDGVLEIVSVDGASADVVIWNPDGSTAEMSGNGTRLAAAWLAQRSGAREVVINVGTRLVPATLRGGGLIETGISGVSADRAETLLLAGEEVSFIAVDVGNPHAVVFGGPPERDRLLRLGPLLEHHQRFPHRTNVQLAHVAGRHDVDALIWERGAGETAASGSSAVAVTAAALSLGACDSPVRVRMPGGELVVAMDGGEATLTGPAVEICSGEVEF